jgi:bifunctional NMN adenylyltransferase/nudix hydrolase
MTEFEFDLLVFIGRFQPFHNEHKRIIDAATALSKKVLILVGSSGKARTIRNPFTFAERRDMIQHHYSDNLIIRPLFDKTYNDSAWVKQVQHIVSSTALEIHNDGGFHNDGIGNMKIGLIGASKDASSYYLKLFPQYNSVNVDIQTDTNSTDIRKTYFEDGFIVPYNNVPENVQDFLNCDFLETDTYHSLWEEYNFVKKYKQSWAVAPYPVKHVTVDAVCEQSGHILLVRRRAAPGKGLWALPGGHLELDETLEEGAIRELKEETKIKVPDAVIRGSIVGSHTFDDPHRSTLGRVVTTAYHIKLRDETKLPKVKGADDADKAKWVPISELREEDFFDDHFHIVNWFLNLA